MTHPLPADIARCPGSGSDAGGWREGCESCLRRTTPPTDHPRVPWMQPPAVIAFECPSYIHPDNGQPDMGIAISAQLKGKS